MNERLLDEIKELVDRRGIEGDDIFAALVSAMREEMRFRTKLPPMPRLPLETRQRLDIVASRSGVAFEAMADKPEARYDTKRRLWVVVDYPPGAPAMIFEGDSPGRPMTADDVLPPLPPVTLHHELRAIAVQHGISLPSEAAEAVAMLRRAIDPPKEKQKPGKWTPAPRPEPVVMPSGDVMVQGMDGVLWAVRGGVATHDLPGGKVERVREILSFDLPFEVAINGANLRRTFDPDGKEWEFFDPHSGRCFRGVAKDWREIGVKPPPPKIDRSVLPKEIRDRDKADLVSHIIEQFDKASGRWLLFDPVTNRQFHGTGIDVLEFTEPVAA